MGSDHTRNIQFGSRSCRANTHILRERVQQHRSADGLQPAVGGTNSSGPDAESVGNTRVECRCRALQQERTTRGVDQIHGGSRNRTGVSGSAGLAADVEAVSSVASRGVAQVDVKIRAAVAGAVVCDTDLAGCRVGERWSQVEVQSGRGVQSAGQVAEGNDRTESVQVVLADFQAADRRKRGARADADQGCCCASVENG